MRLVAALGAAAFWAGAALAQEPRLSDEQAGQLVADCIGPEYRDSTLEQLSPALRETLLSCTQAYAVRNLRARLPVRVDEVTTLEAIASEGTMVIYTNRINLDRSELVADAGQRLDESTRRNVCNQQDMVATLSYGGSYAYVWIDRSGQLVHRTEIRSC